MTFTAGPDMNGDVLVEVYLDGDGANDDPNVDISETQTFQIIIEPVNDAPNLF